MSQLLLPPRQYALISELVRHSSGVNVDDLAKAVKRKPQDIMRDLEELKGFGLVNIEKVTVYEVRISDVGAKYLKEGLPEERVLNIVKKLSGSVSIARLKELLLNTNTLSKDEFSAALGILRRLGVISIKGGYVRLVNERIHAFEIHKENLRRILRDLLNTRRLGNSLPEYIKELRRRGLVRVRELKVIKVIPTPKLIESYSKGMIKEAEVVTALTQEIILSGRWRRAIFKKFDLGIEVPRLYPKRKHPYIQFLNYIRYIISNMGFKEFKGPYVESELWNFDILFVPQYHPSRRPTDVYFIKNEDIIMDIPEDVLVRVKRIHEKVLNYSWSERRALQPILRTHTTPVSVRTIHKLGSGEYRVFSLDRVFRPDTPDPTHLMEFHQLEGIIVGRNVTFKHLLGFFKEFAHRLGLGEVKFKPAYFPFTEPSVEGYIKHPKLGWIEVFPGGMFRPEVLNAVGLKGYNVAAWGIGIDRIAMIVLGIDDIRDLYTNNLSAIRKMRIPVGVIK